MLGTIINVGAILIGTIFGLLFKKHLSKRIRDSVMMGLGLCVLIIGLTNAMKTQNMVLLVASLSIGGGVGDAINIEGRLNTKKKKLEKATGKIGKKDQENLFVQSFVTGTLVYCVGAMAIVGAIESGLQGNHQTLFAKAMLDGITAVFFASTLGPGVAFSAVAVLLYQGTITLLAKTIAPIMSEDIIREMSAVGGVLIIGIGIGLLKIKEIPVGNLLPSIIIPVAYGLLLRV